MINKVSKVLLITALTAFCLIFSLEDLVAQCPMCKMATESNLENGGTAGQGLNAGILYMLATPYLLIGTLAFIWWKNKKKNVDGEEELV